MVETIGREIGISNETGTYVCKAGSKVQEVYVLVIFCKNPMKTMNFVAVGTLLVSTNSMEISCLHFYFQIIID